MEIRLDKNQRIAAIGTLLFSILVIALLLLLSMTPPYPPEELPGMEVSLGDSYTGSGDSEPEEVSQTPTTSSTVHDPSDVVTQDVSDVHINQNPKVDPNPNTNPDPDPDPVKVIDDKLIFDADKHKGGGQGPGNDPGNVGNPNGDKNSTNINGTGGAGTGTSYSIVGRTALKIEPAATGFTKSGKVRVKIYVDRNGNVTNAVVELKGSNTDDKDLERRAVAAALKSKFNVKSDALAEQVGFITYNFVVQ